MRRNSNDITSVLRIWYGSRLLVIAESIFIGLVTGFVVVGFRLLLNRNDRLRSAIYQKLASGGVVHLLVWILILIAVGLLLGWMSAKRPMIRGSGIPQLKGALIRKMNLDWKSELPMKIVGGVLGIGAGLSLGREGPSVQMGAYVGKGVLSLARRPNVERKYLITSGAAAGLAAAFNAPLAGVIFALEELQKSFSPLLLACAMGASMAGDLVAAHFFGLRPAFDFRFIQPLPITMFPWIVFLGVASALLGDLFKRSLYAAQDINAFLRIPVVIRPILPLLVSIPLGFYLFDVTGGGHHLIEALTMRDTPLMVLALLFGAKLLFTALSYGSGTAGGIFLPLLVCGALAGNAFGKIVSLTGFAESGQVLNFTILGMAAFFTAVVKAPVTGAVLILEMSGNFNHLGGLVLACLSAYVAADLMGSKAVYDVLLTRILKAGTPAATNWREGMTIVEVPVGASSLIAHQFVKSVEWPKNCLVVGVTRGEEELIPRGNTEILPGDTLAVLMEERQVGEYKEGLIRMGENRT